MFTLRMSISKAKQSVGRTPISTPGSKNLSKSNYLSFLIIRSLSD